LLAFLCWFGGIGYVLVRAHLFAIPVTLALALLAGIAGAGAIFAFLVKVLLPHERELLPEDTEMRGVIGRITSVLRPGATGEIHFSMNGTRRSAAARTAEQEPIPPHSQVVVVRYERGIAYVRRFAELDEWSTPQTPT
jgi:membrane protein implicated in regulation of membrane protease activity